MHDAGKGVAIQKHDTHVCSTCTLESVSGGEERQAYSRVGAHLATGNASNHLLGKLVVDGLALSLLLQAKARTQLQCPHSKHERPQGLLPARQPRQAGRKLHRLRRWQK